MKNHSFSHKHIKKCPRTPQKGIKTHSMKKIEKKEKIMKKSKERPLIRSNRGITLIALVITIIVLLILAGVSFSLMAGSDGILGKASNATDQTKKATAKEQVELLLADYKADYFEGKYVEGTENSNPKEYIQGKLEPGKVTGDYYVKATGDNVKVYEGKDTTGKAILKGTLQEDGSIQWGEISEDDELLEEANANPEKYRHPEQQKSNTLGIGVHGEAINMDLWIYQGAEWENGQYRGYALCNEGYTSQGPYYDTAYLGSDFDNIVIPKYIKTAEDEEFKPVSSLLYTFDGCSQITKAPEVPNSVTSMEGTFIGCTSLSEAPIIPNSVTDMSYTFSGCTNLSQVPIIPNSVTSMEGTFSGCTNLSQAPIIPNSVTSMEGTFSGCTNLSEVPIILNSVTSMEGTFRGCTSLREAPIIPNSVTNMRYTFKGCTSLSGTIRINSSDIANSSYNIGIFDEITNNLIVQVPANSATYDTISKGHYGSKITIETF